MDELEQLQKENRLLKDKIQKLEEKLSIVADMMFIAILESEFIFH